MANAHRLFAGTSLRTRLTLGMLVIGVLLAGLIALGTRQALRAEMEETIAAQQFSAVSLAAGEVDRSVRERMAAVEAMAVAVGRQGHSSLASPQALQQYLEALPNPGPYFNWGISVIDTRGMVVASVPREIGRTGLNLADLAYVQEVLSTGRTVISDPFPGRSSGQLIMTVAAPIRGSGNAGPIVGILVGVTNLNRPNFLDEISQARYGVTGDFFITTPHSRRYLATSDKGRLARGGPPPGVNPVYDQYIDGYEGSGVAVSSQGVLELSSSKRIPTTGWLMQSVLPAEEAFAPVRAMQRRLLEVTLGFTLLAALGITWWLGRQLGPLTEASGRLAAMGSGELPREALPVRRQDEIGQLATAFNALLARIVAEEAKAADHAANERIRKIVSQVPGVVFQYRRYTDGEGGFPFASEAFEGIYGVSPEAVRTHAGAIRDMVVEEDRERFLTELERSAQTLTPWRVEYRIRRASGEIRWLLVDAMPEAEPAGEMVGERVTAGVTWYGFVADITEAKATEEALRIAATTFQTQEGILVTDARGLILRVNPAFTRITGYSQEEAAGHTPALLKSGRHDRAFYEALWSRLITEGSWEGELWNRRKNGELYPSAVTITAVRDGAGHPTHFVAIFQDITTRKAAEEEIRSLAFYDPLTHLPNRRLLIDRLRLILAHQQANPDTAGMGAIIFLDLDNFKTLNDSQGHDVGDQLLVAVANRLQTTVRDTDTVARLGGDEFVVLIDGLATQAQEAQRQADTLADKILTAMTRPFPLPREEYRGSSSLGLALFQGSGSVEEILKQADLAMYQAKAAGRNTYRFFDPIMQARINFRSLLEGELHTALENREFLLHYQPQVDRHCHCTGVEALVRWPHSRRGMIPPSEFIPLAEESGLILALGTWVLEEACRQLASWAEQAEMPPLTVAVNVSARQFHEPGFVEKVRTHLAASGANPARLKLEITESVLLSDVDEAVYRMESLRELGVRFSLDDFGTGYSSLSYLKRLPLEEIKIDQSFVRDILTDPNDAAICRAIIGLGKSLGLNVLAEGVETPGQWEFLLREGCPEVQGYLHARPMAPVDLARWLAATPSSTTLGTA